MATVNELLDAINQADSFDARVAIIRSIGFGMGGALEDPGTEAHLITIASRAGELDRSLLSGFVTDADLAGWIAPQSVEADPHDIFKFLSKPSAPSTFLVGTDVYSIDPNGALRVTREDGSGGTFDLSGFDLETGAPLPPTASAATATAGGLGVASALAGSTGGGFDVAFGFPLFSQMTDLILRADANRRATIDQNVSILRLMSDLERVSPTRAASLAAGLGLPEPDLSFLSVLQSGAPAFGRGGASAGGGTSFGGMVGTQNVSLPSFLSGAQLTNLQANPNIAQIVLDVADRFGRPDLFTQSAAGVVPTSPTLLAAAG